MTSPCSGSHGSSAARRPKRARASAAPDGDIDAALFEALRAERLALSRERHVPPYVIFHDSTLRHLARMKPGTREALLEVPGIGESKVERFGERMLGVIRTHDR